MKYFKFIFFIFFLLNSKKLYPVVYLDNIVIGKKLTKDIIKKIHSQEYAADYLKIIFSTLNHKKIINLAKAINNNPKIKFLYLMGNKLGNDGLKCLVENLRGNKSLYGLSIIYNKIEDEGLKDLVYFLQENASIKELNLAGNKITNDGGYMLDDLLTSQRYTTEIYTLNLNYNKLTAYTFENNTKLKHLSLSNNNIRFTTKLRDNNALISLNLAENNLLYKKDLNILAEWIKTNKSLKILNLYNKVPYKLDEYISSIINTQLINTEIIIYYTIDPYESTTESLVTPKSVKKTIDQKSSKNSNKHRMLKRLAESLFADITRKLLSNVDWKMLPGLALGLL